jgi:hypothetical protein
LTLRDPRSTLYSSGAGPRCGQQSGPPNGTYPCGGPNSQRRTTTECKLMRHSHTPASRASTTTPAALDAQHDPEANAENAAETPADPPARRSEGPACSGASEGPPSDRSPPAPAPAPSEPLGPLPSPCLPRPVRWDEPEDVRAWLARARARVADLAALAREGCRHGKDRVLSRAERGRQTRAAEHSLRMLLDAAEAGLVSLPTRRGDRSE